MRFSQRIASVSKTFVTYLVLLISIVAIRPDTALPQGEVSLWGTVSDSSGAAIAGAQVSVLNLETGSTRSLVTDESGKFNATALNVGHYEVAASKAGF
ncbi:MAG: carboxypeptidase regulatory-like domain-containing protein, partial [Acidobacteria bacterium]|nr:carboxypeptidase regulatory-like domain-containing protein [Acidobacteriota bacterium]